MHGFDSWLHALVTLLVTIDPPGNAPLFLGVTAGLSQSERFQVALRSTMTAFIILVVFAVAGSTILKTMGISIGAFRIAGGLLLFWISFEMIFEKRKERREQHLKKALSKDQLSNLATFPLAIPIIAGPGSISAVILLASSRSGPVEHIGLIIMILVVMIAMFAAMIIANRLNKFLGQSGQAVLTRLLGVLLAALSVQFVVDGVKSIWPVAT
ncbi:MAG: MarC family protein [Alphaproteobacteria bacterium]|nr:MarC family protein [Alphaproteobacteria bacterium]